MAVALLDSRAGLVAPLACETVGAMPLTADATANWTLHPDAKPPLAVEGLHHRWLIVDDMGINRARVVETGAVLLPTEADARTVLERLTNG